MQHFLDSTSSSYKLPGIAGILRISFLLIPLLFLLTCLTLFYAPDDFSWTFLSSPAPFFLLVNFIILSLFITSSPPSQSIDSYQSLPLSPFDPNPHLIHPSQLWRSRGPCMGGINEVREDHSKRLLEPKVQPCTYLPTKKPVIQQKQVGRIKSDRCLSVPAAMDSNPKLYLRASSTCDDKSSSMIALETCPAVDHDLSDEELKKRCDEFIANSRSRMKRELLEHSRELALT